MSVDMELAGRWAARYAPRPARPRRWPSPGAMAVQLDPATIQTPALDLIDAALVDVADGRCDRLIVTMPPQEGKSERCSRRFPLWLVEQNPDLRIGIASYELETARRWGRTVRDDIRTFNGTDGELDLGLRIRGDSDAADRWQITGHIGGLRSVGVGGALTGWPLDGIIIDDPFKDHAQANSAVYRQRVWEWFTSVVLTRLAPGGWVVLVQTPWHEDDLRGRLLLHEPGRWRHISIPAQAEDSDPLDRQPGEWLESTRQRTAEQWDSKRREVGEWVWAALYQQRPAPAEGGLFKRSAWRYWTPLHDQRIDLAGRLVDLRDCWRFATIDLAASTKTSADYTVVSVWAAAGTDALVLLDRRRARLGEVDHWSLARPLIERWRVDTAFVEASFITSTLVRDATRAGLLMSPVAAESDKFTRAIPYSARVDAGGVWLPAGASWLSEWVEEHAGFPNGSHDDQVDTGSYAVRVLGTGWNPGGDPAPPDDDNEHAELDLMNAPM